VNCYLCGNGGLSTLTTQLRYGDGVVRHCDRCDLGMLEHDAEDLAAYYRDVYRAAHGPSVGEASSYDAIFAAYVDHQDERVALLRPHLQPEARLLEIGCSTGHFLANVGPFVGEAVGVDYDVGAAAYAAERTGRRTYGMGLEETDLEPASFDVVCAFQTMEHVEDPVAFASLVGRYLAPGGVALIEVPNLYDPLRSVFDSPGYRRFYYHRAHLFYFSPRSLALVAERAGLSGDVFSMQDYNLLNQIHWVFTDTPQADSGPGLGAPRLPLVEGVDPALRDELAALFDEADARYKAILRSHDRGENLVFLGRAA
jgi:SAM-dependent methyltransferase